MTLGHVHVMCILLAVKFLLAVDAAISAEFVHWYPHPTLSSTPHRECSTVINIPFKHSTPKAQTSIVAGKAASRNRFHGWLYPDFWDCSVVCDSWRLTLSLGSWRRETYKKRPTLSDLFSAHIRRTGIWRLLRLDQGDLNVPIVVAVCGVLISVYKVNRARRCCWQGCLLTLSTQAQGGCRHTQQCCTTPGPRSKLWPGHQPNRPWLSCKEEKVILIEANFIEQ